MAANENKSGQLTTDQQLAAEKLKVEDLVNQVNELKKSNAELQTRNEDLVKQVDDKTTAFDKLQAQLDEAKEGLNQLASAQVKAAGDKVIDFSGKKYKQVVPQFRLHDFEEVITYEHLKADADLVKRVLAIDGQGFLEEIF
jgi:uncharacterized coiled-coil DUF342 family protein